jgi:16S rRNA (guanine527-N7)-methyltransferase
VSQPLRESLEQHQIPIAGDDVERLDHYCRLLWSWNEQINLTRHTDYDTFVARDLADTLQLSAFLEAGEEVLDVGSGGGVPGVPLAILRPDLEITLSESVAKKAKVLNDIVERLDLPVAVYNARAESLFDDFRFDVLTARAVGPMWKLCKWFEPHWASIGRILSIKGPRWVEERKEARHRGYMNQLDLRKVAEYPLAGADGPSVILQISHSRSE